MICPGKRSALSCTPLLTTQVIILIAITTQIATALLEIQRSCSRCTGPNKRCFKLDGTRPVLCYCDYGYYGPDCKWTNFCQFRNPCWNGGNIIVNVGPGVPAPPSCSIGSPCKAPFRKCVQHSKHYHTCVMDDRTLGAIERLENFRDVCIMRDPYRNGGTCDLIESSTSYNCTCTGEYHGTTCNDK
ncbi:unnamed protein product, partial [Owenia fusiformis]